MKKLLLFLSFIISVPCLNAQIIFQENFEAGILPTGWTMQTNATDGGWRVGSAANLSSNAFGIIPNGSNRIAGTNDDFCNCNKRNEYLITPALDLTGFTNIALSFDAFYTDNSYQGAREDATIEISLDGINWEILEDMHGHGSWDKHQIDLSMYAGEDTVYIGFRYDDGGSWLYGFAIDNVTVEVPLTLDVELAELNYRTFGETNENVPLGGTLYNNGTNAFTNLNLTYTIDGGSPVSEVIDNVDIPSFSYYNFEFTNRWMPTAAGKYTVDVTIDMVNGVVDEDQNNNSSTFEIEIFDDVVVPNKIDRFLDGPPIISLISGASTFLNKPSDLDFFPVLGKDELWVVNQRSENTGGNTLRISNATNGPSEFLSQEDGNSWHFMSLPTAIAFSSDNFNFASSPGVQDANHSGGTFTGPSLWSSDPAVYAQPSGGNGSHLDMLHGSPFSMGIAHEVDNVFWVYDDWHKDIVRYDFVDDHGPGNDDHSDGIVRRYQNIGIDADGDIPNHMILDKSTGWLYFVDNGNDRIVRLDINSGSVGSALGNLNEPLAEHSSMTGFTTEVIITEGLEQPCGIEIMDNRLLVGDYANGDIIVFDMDNGFEELGRIPTEEAGLTGIKIGPDGNIWYTNRIRNTLSTAEPGLVSSATEIDRQPEVIISPNPTTGILSIGIPDWNGNTAVSAQLTNASGQEIRDLKNLKRSQQLDLSDLPIGVYFMNISADSFSSTKKIVLTR